MVNSMPTTASEPLKLFLSAVGFLLLKLIVLIADMLLQLVGMGIVLKGMSYKVCALLRKNSI